MTNVELHFAVDSFGWAVPCALRPHLVAKREIQTACLNLTFVVTCAGAECVTKNKTHNNTPLAVAPCARKSLVSVKHTRATHTRTISSSRRLLL